MTRSVGHTERQADLLLDNCQSGRPRPYTAVVQICVVGVGNVYASDDGVGPEIVRRLYREPFGKRFDSLLGDEPTTLLSTGVVEEPGSAGVIDSGSVDFVTLRQAGVELLELMDRCDVLFVVDAVSSGAPAGTVHREQWRPNVLASRGVDRASSHGFGVRELLDLAAALDRLPACVVLWGIEIASTEPRTGLSPAVADAVPGIVARLKHELEGFMIKNDANAL